MPYFPPNIYIRARRSTLDGEKITRSSAYMKLFIIVLLTEQPVRHAEREQCSSHQYIHYNRQGDRMPMLFATYCRWLALSRRYTPMFVTYCRWLALGRRSMPMLFVTYSRWLALSRRSMPMLFATYCRRLALSRRSMSMLFVTYCRWLAE